MLGESQVRGSLQNIGVQQTAIIGLLKDIRRNKGLSEDEVALLAADKVTPALPSLLTLH